MPSETDRKRVRMRETGELKQGNRDRGERQGERDRGERQWERDSGRETGGETQEQSDKSRESR